MAEANLTGSNCWLQSVQILDQSREADKSGGNVLRYSNT